MKNSPLILALDTSCDDTAAAIVCGHEVWSNVVSSQIKLHQPYGGVFPTVAKLEHQKNIAPVTHLALQKAKVDFAKLDAIAVTIGPGLAPALEVGINYAKQLAKEHHLPLIAINHVEAHALSALLQPKPRNDSKLHPTNPNNTLSIVISGGHTEFIWINSIGSYQILGQTLDDAAGECLDKIGRLLGLGYPAAPLLEELAKEGRPLTYPFPLPLTTTHDFNLSFSGLKTHAKNTLRDLSQANGGTNAELNFSHRQILDFAASAQQGVFKHLLYKLNKLFTHFATHASQEPSLPSLVLLGGGVAANNKLRQELRSLIKKWSKNCDQNIQFLAPSKKFCGDNAAMIGLVATHKFAAGKIETDLDSVERQPNLKVTSWL